MEYFSLLKVILLLFATALKLTIWYKSTTTNCTIYNPSLFSPQRNLFAEMRFKKLKQKTQMKMFNEKFNADLLFIKKNDSECVIHSFLFTPREGTLWVLKCLKGIFFCSYPWLIVGQDIESWTVHNFLSKCCRQSFTVLKQSWLLTRDLAWHLSFCAWLLSGSSVYPRSLRFCEDGVEYVTWFSVSALAMRFKSENSCLPVLIEWM